MWSLGWVSVRGFSSIVQIIENISATQATNSMALRGVKRRVRSEDLPTSHTQSFTRRTARLFTSTASKSQLFLARMKPKLPFGNIQPSLEKRPKKRSCHANEVFQRAYLLHGVRLYWSPSTTTASRRWRRTHDCK